MICVTCGREITDEAAICPCCGCLTGVSQLSENGNHGNRFVDKSNTPYAQLGTPINPTTNTYVNRVPYSEPDKVNPWLVIVALLFPILGLIFGINEQNHGKKSGKVYVILATINLIIQLIISVIGVVILIFVWHKFEIYYHH